MATAKIKIENGKVVAYEGRYEEYLENGHFSGNGWSSRYDDKGNLIIEAVRDYSDGENSIRLTIRPTGSWKVTTKFGDNAKRRLVKSGSLSTTLKEANITVGLAGGNIKDRYCFIRETAFTEFLQQYGLTAVEKADPNKEIMGRISTYCFEKAFCEVYTDGNLEIREERGGGGLYFYRYFTITGATWVVKDVWNRENGHYHATILYTLEDVYSLDLSKLKEK